MSGSSPPTRKRPRYHYRATPRTLDFPTDVGLPETRRHYELRTALYQILKLALGGRACLGSDQMIYWNAADPSRRLSPDLFIRLGAADEMFAAWKSWERGAPDVAVEIVSDHDATELAWDEKLARYRELGVRELVRFDPVAPGESLRVWDRLEEDLVERLLDDTRIAESSVLGLTWVVMKDAQLGRVLRLAADPEATQLLPTPVEREAQLRLAAEQRVRELEEQLRRKGG